jgi:hypothetical protein
MVRNLFFILLFIPLAARSADYFPLDVGNYWDYRITRDSAVTPSMRLEFFCDTCIGSDTILSSGYINPLPAGSDTIRGYLLKRGNDVFTCDSMLPISGYYKLAEHHPAAGDTWSDRMGRSCRLVYWGNVTVPAGTFDSCFAVVEEKDSLTQIYAPDVGIIKTVSHGKTLYHLTAYYVGRAGVSEQRHIRPATQCRGGTKSPPADEYSLVNVSGRVAGTVIVSRGQGISGNGFNIPSGFFFLLPKFRPSGEPRIAEKALYLRK